MEVGSAGSMPDLSISDIAPDAASNAADDSALGAVLTPGQLGKHGVPTRDGKGHTAIIRQGQTKLKISPRRNPALAVSGQLPMGWSEQVGRGSPMNWLAEQGAVAERLRRPKPTNPYYDGPTPLAEQRPALASSSDGEWPLPWSPARP